MPIYKLRSVFPGKECNIIKERKIEPDLALRVREAFLRTSIGIKLPQKVRGRAWAPEGGIV